MDPVVRRRNYTGHLILLCVGFQFLNSIILLYLHCEETAAILYAYTSMHTHTGTLNSFSCMTMVSVGVCVCVCAVCGIHSKQ